jgi:signal transduction histidine kinase
LVGVAFLDVPTALRLAGLLYLLVPVTVYLVLRRSHDCRSLMAWCGGASLYGLGYLLIGLRTSIPDWVSIHVANLMVIASFALRISSLRSECAKPAGWRAGTLLVVLCFLIFVLADWQSDGLRVYLAMLMQTVGSAWLAWAAADIWRHFRLRVARAMALAFATLALAVLWASLEVGLGGWRAFVHGESVAVTMALVTAFIVSLYGNLGFMGLVIERAHGNEVLHARELERVSAQRLAAEEQATQLLAWLAERDELLRLMAHEVRQPLNNASAALQAARKALTPAGMDHAAAGQRVQRAELVLGQIIGTLDNTLAATALLASPDRVERRDVDVDTLTTLAIGDLESTQRQRVQVHSQDAMRTALMDAGLIRLALRNLLSNALAYSRPDAPVVLRVSDLEEPLSLVLEVLDQGPGIEPALAERLFERGVRGNQTGPGHGLGLYVVRRVMELHGGSVDLRPNPGGGTIFRLQLPQDMPDRRRKRREGRDGRDLPDQASTSAARKM